VPQRRHKAKARTGLTDAMLDEPLHGPGCVLDHTEPTYPMVNC
jgi:hypothetical protein